MKMRIISCLAVISLTVGCAHYHGGADACGHFVPIPPLPPPPTNSVWQPPAWWNGTTGLTCLVHGTPRIQASVPIEYGLLMNDDPEYPVAEEKFFPNTWHYVAGGCCVMNDSPKAEIVRYCPECRRIEAEWIKNRKVQREQGDGKFARYVVHQGDTLSGLARKFKDRDSLESIIRRNGIHDPDKIMTGQILYIQKRKPEDSEAQHPPAN